MAEQLALPLGFNPELGFEQFWPGPNAEAVAHLQQAIQGAAVSPVFIWGEAGAGKTHFVLPRGESGRNQEELRAYGQTGQPCARCGAEIARILVGQRATHICPACQRQGARKR